MAKKAKTATVQITLTRSTIGALKDQIATAASLGLRKVGDTTCQPDNAATQGKITKISHLIEVTRA